MNARTVVTPMMIGLLVIVLTGAAHAEWYRPGTWGDKKPAASSQQKNKKSGVVGGAKRAITKTADVLTPWDNKKKKDNPHDGAARFFRPDIAHRKKENQSAWYRPATWFRGEETPEKPLTVTDWMAQDRPEFENR